MNKNGTRVKRAQERMGVGGDRNGCGENGEHNGKEKAYRQERRKKGEREDEEKCMTPEISFGVNHNKDCREYGLVL